MNRQQFEKRLEELSHGSSFYAGAETLFAELQNDPQDFSRAVFDVPRLVKMIAGKAANRMLDRKTPRSNPDAIPGMLEWLNGR